ncbi:hypothetical protein Tco_0929934, partial [Tanacetum coccineum]
RIVILEDEDAEEDFSKQGRKISEIDKGPTISLVHPEEDMEYDFDVSTAEGFTITSVPVTNASASISTVSPLRVSTAEDISGAETLINEEEKQRIARDAEIAKQLQEEFNRARQEQEVVAEANQAHDINWSDLAVLRYHAVQNRSFSKDEDSEIEKEVMKRPGFDFQQNSSKKRSREDSDEDNSDEDNSDEDNSDEDNAKKQKLKDDVEKKELRDSMDVVLRDDIAI